MKSRDTTNKSGICDKTSVRFVFASSVRPMGNRPAGKVALARQAAKPSKVMVPRKIVRLASIER